MNDLYQSVTNRIIAAMEQGTAPWIAPWVTSPEQALPANLSSGHRYRGINVLLLNMVQMANAYPLNRWLTFQQARALGGHVRRGQSGTEVVFFKMLEVDGDRVYACAPAANDGPRHKVVPLLRSFTVFNAAQVDDLPQALTAPPATSEAFDSNAAAEAVLMACGATIRHGGDRAFYRPSDDMICLPNKEAFVSPSRYYSVALHEATHWSGHPSRCNRVLLGRQHIEAYAFEELVAELGSAFLCSHVGISNELHHASYLSHWLTALRSDKKLIFAAASLAQKAADFLLATQAMAPNPQAAAIAA
jgi:antirestriction protein ArdC